jgi:hypothetical protein
MTVIRITRQETQAKQITTGDHGAAVFMRKLRPKPNRGGRRRLSGRMADELRLDVGKPNVIRPLIGADCDRVAAAIIRAIDQDIAHAGSSHFPEGNFLLAGEGLAWPMILPIGHEGKPPRLGLSQPRHTRRAMSPWMRSCSARHLAAPP